MWFIGQSIYLDLLLFYLYHAHHFFVHTLCYVPVEMPAIAIFGLVTYVGNKSVGPHVDTKLASEIHVDGTMIPTSGTDEFLELVRKWKNMSDQKLTLDKDESITVTVGPAIMKMKVGNKTTDVLIPQTNAITWSFTKANTVKVTKVLNTF